MNASIPEWPDSRVLTKITDKTSGAVVATGRFVEQFDTKRATYFVFNELSHHALYPQTVEKYDITKYKFEPVELSKVEIHEDYFARGGRRRSRRHTKSRSNRHSTHRRSTHRKRR